MPRKIGGTVSILLAGGHFGTIGVPIGAPDDRVRPLDP